jgi:hypothetical protein
VHLGGTDLAHVVRLCRAADESSVTMITNKVETGSHWLAQKLGHSAGIAVSTVTHNVTEAVGMNYGPLCRIADTLISK